MFSCVRENSEATTTRHLRSWGLTCFAVQSARKTVGQGTRSRGSTIVTTVEIESILGTDELAALLEAGEASGQIRQVELQELLEPLELDVLELEAVHMELDRRGIELVVEEPEKEKEATPPPPAAVTPVSYTHLTLPTIYSV